MPPASRWPAVSHARSGPALVLLRVSLLVSLAALLVEPLLLGLALLLLLLDGVLGGVVCEGGQVGKPGGEVGGRGAPGGRVGSAAYLGGLQPAAVWAQLLAQPGLGRREGGGTGSGYGWSEAVHGSGCGGGAVPAGG